MRIVPVPCLKDNYAYLVICEATNAATVVDPSEAAPVLAALEREGVALQAIWNTHHHWDHVGGNKELLQRFQEIDVVGHASDKDRIPGQNRFVEDGEEVSLGEELRAQILFNPGHTRGAISYQLAAHDAVFTGDTLFLAGCGRLFEGTAEQMHSSLSRLAALPPTTRVFCGHEYTVANLRFAAAVEPDNQAVSERAAEVAKLREAGQPSVPASIALERVTNPFLRTDVAEVIESVRASEAAAQGEEDSSGAAIFAALRRWKDSF
ncbi:hydroxyacylglutathione hydrolase [Haliangium ochraceum]|uniref:Hydroxyacylglutathione hydrolase n=1 Tax=Haliangium ochraceum (strain DSM 14365 / JCM 11303 / SMP-2) TaxID=502025 RepID=D0LYH8_HALO1|nr:hydroxyacylglutathione hydrolase [Haliangium ochraceum]ACY17844.1 hydroxyacylglutathione hydrolase [Haliangium ochraceum DSM 14365]